MTSEFSGGWGLGAIVSAATVFKLVDATNPEKIHARIQATYSVRFLLRQADADEGIKAAIVTLSLLEDSMSGVAPPSEVSMAVLASNTANVTEEEKEGEGEVVDDDGDAGSIATTSQLSVSAELKESYMERVAKKLPIRLNVYAWGRSEDGILGIGSVLNKTVPTPTPLSFDAILGVARVVSVAAGLYHSAAVTDGEGCSICIYYIILMSRRFTS